ncbi:MAG: NADAR family protein [Myxococcaceae bacterium]|nr:NADAR family protein [Myxococcaceae bacterium]MCA3011699.1 NADAR family protein [Myxococcaceae bacterium]
MRNVRAPHVLQPRPSSPVRSPPGTRSGASRLRDRSQTRASPAAQKALGRTVRRFDDGVWARHRFDVVAFGSFAKFSQDEALRAHLLSTGDAVLVEASPRDRVWGIGLGRDNPLVQQPARWRGQNLLGFALVHARDVLRGVREAVAPGPWLAAG